MIFWIALTAAVIVVLTFCIFRVSDDLDDDAEQEAWLREYERIREEDRQWQKRRNEMRAQRSREQRKQHEDDNKKREAVSEKPDGKPHGRA